jgi:small-conductance mechanosensitive channel
VSTDSKASPTTNRISSFVFMIVIAVMALSIVAFGLAAWAYLADNLTSAVFLTITGVIAMTLSAYVLLQTRRTAVATKTAPAKVMTTVECKKCGVKNVRDFQRGDYVYKELEACQKCPEEKMVVTAIYKEIKEKEKTYNF